MFSALNPLLLWGLAGISVPILIHMLMRQRPRPRPWAAMRWLAAAMKAVQRRYKLTNLLLLLLRCLVLALLALALARPSLSGVGQGSELVLVVDTSASLGPLGNGGGAIEAVHRQLSGAGIDNRLVRVVSVGQQIQERYRGPGSEALRVLSRLETDLLPGGLDRAAEGERGDALLSLIGDDADVVLVSDFRQDDGQALSALIEPHARVVRRWRVGQDGPNALVTGIRPLGDLVPGEAGALLIEVQGRVRSGQLTINDGNPTPVTFLESADDNQPAAGDDSDDRSTLRLALPPLPGGSHELSLELDDNGLMADNRVEFPLTIRPRVTTLTVADEWTYIGAALRADRRTTDNRQVRAAALAATPLPDRGLVALREPVLDGSRLADWVREGGVLWLPLPVLTGDPALASLAPGLDVAGDPVPGGPVSAGSADLDASLARVVVPSLPPLVRPPGSSNRLTAGSMPLVVQVPVGDGLLLVEAVDLQGVDSLWAAGAIPEWVRRTVRDTTMRLHDAAFSGAGRISDEDREVERDGRVVSIAAGAPIELEPGLWKPTSNDSAGSPLVILPDAAEGRLQARPDSRSQQSLTEILPNDRGGDWGWALLVAALLVLCFEGALAAWAGKTYGR